MTAVRDPLADCSDDEATMCGDEDLRKVEFARRGHLRGSDNRVRDDSAEKKQTFQMRRLASELLII